MIRCCAIVLAAWALQVVPTLCVGGLLSHHCACESISAPILAVAANCDHDVPGCRHDGTCEHESDCGFDPCTTTVARADQIGGGVMHGASSGGMVSNRPQPILNNMSGPLVAGVASESYRGGLGIHRSDIPLLI